MNNLTQEQKIERIVSVHIGICQSYLVEALFKNNMLEYESIENGFIYPEIILSNKDIFDGGTQDELGKFKEQLHSELEELTNKRDEINEDDREPVELDAIIATHEDSIAELELLEQEPQEILEWWIVTNWLADKLKAIGEPILEAYGTIWWGRTCSGQAISMDYTIQRIEESL